MLDNRNIIIDVGMHDGKDSEYYARRGFSVIAFEANTEICQTARERFKNAELDEKIDIRNLAISNNSGEEVTFYVNKFNTTWSSLDKDIGSRRSGSDAVKVLTCNLSEELLDLHDKIHMIKIDIEGYDQIALEQVSKLPTHPPFISVENGGIDLLNTLKDMGYTGFQYSNQMYVPCQTVPSDSVHGDYIEHRFVRSQSGLFGHDLPLRWLDYEEAKSIAELLGEARRRLKGNLLAEAIGWFDLHAAKDPKRPAR